MHGREVGNTLSSNKDTLEFGCNLLVKDNGAGGGHSHHHCENAITKSGFYACWLIKKLQKFYQ